MGGLLHLFHLDNQSMARKLVMHNKHVDGKFFIFHFFFIFFFVILLLFVLLLRDTSLVEIRNLIVLLCW